MYHTQKEILHEVNKNFKIGALQLEKGNISLEEMKEFMPKLSLLFISRKTDLVPTYICALTEEWLGLTIQKIQQKGLDFIYDHTHLNDFKIAYPRFRNYSKFGDHTQPFSQWMRIRASINDEYLLVRTTVLGSEKFNGLITMHHLNISKTDDLITAKKIMDAREVEFTRKNLHKFLKLTEKEKILLGFLGTGWRTKDIAAYQYTSNENIRKQIKQINEKLELTHTKWNKAAIHAKYALSFGLFVDPQ